MPELMAAMLIFAVGGIALISTLDTSQRVGSNSERREEAVALAEQELASIQSLSYANVALTGVPAESANAVDPAYYVTRVGASPYTGSWYRWDQPGVGSNNPPARCSASGAPSSSCSNFVISASGVDPTPTTKSVTLKQGTRARYQVHRFVTWVDDPSTTGCAQDYKRVTVAANAINAKGNRMEVGPSKPAIVSTFVANADAGLLTCG